MLGAARSGRDILRAGGAALDAVVETVRLMENHALFNAGFGSVLNSEGRVEMDASTMVYRKSSRGGDSGGVSIEAGAVANLTMVRNPILLARAIMQASPHVMLTGPGAERFGRALGIEQWDPQALVSDRARDRFVKTLGPAAKRESHGTVGAVALDQSGALASATSTGGISGKMPGRVGDSAIIGAGTFAGRFGAAAATGMGEAIIKLTLCRDAIAALRRFDPQTAAERVIKNLGCVSGAEAGIIVVDHRGRLGFAHNAAAMEIAYGSSANSIRYTRLKPIPAAAR
jgi:beta-aspartyl-peptidase (threonine type)